MIDGVTIAPLRPNVDERGFLMEILRESDPHFHHFSQVYVSKSYPGVIRAWHYHARQNDIWCVLSGTIKAVLFDNREDSPTFGEVQEVFLGDDNHAALVIPIGVVHGYKCIGNSPCLLLNFTDNLYNREMPDEFRIPWNDSSVPYDWDIKLT